MGVIIADWGEITLRYPEIDKLAAVSSSAVNTPGNVAVNKAAIISNAEAYVHGRLAQAFTVPFSSNNYTARDLAIDTVYVQNVLSRQIVQGKTVASSLEARIVSLIDGAMQMVDVNGTICAVAPGDPVWSNQMHYHPTFGLGDAVVTAVDSQELIDQNNARGWPTDEAL
jgi:hypothetical protein